MPNPKKISDQCLRDFIDAGISQSEIGRTCGITRQGISARVLYQSKKSQILLKQYTVRFLHRLGFSFHEIAGLTDYSYHSVRKLVRKRFRRIQC